MRQRVGCEVAYNADGNTTWGRSEFRIMAPALQVLACCMHADKRQRKRGQRPVAILERPSDGRTCVFATVVKLGPDLTDRQFVQCLRWREKRPGLYQITNFPVEHGDRPRGEGLVRGAVRVITEFEFVDARETKVTRVGYGELGGRIPQMVVNTRAASFTCEMQQMLDGTFSVWRNAGRGRATVGPVLG